MIDLCCRNLRRQRKQEYYGRERKKQKITNITIGKENKNWMKDNLKSVDSLIEELTAEQREELENNSKPMAQKKTE